MSESQPPGHRSYSSPEEVFARFSEQFGLDGDGDINAIALFAYALVEKDRLEWAHHIQLTTGERPNHDAVSAWFRDKPEQYFLEKTDQAHRWFAGFARLLLREEVEQEKNVAVSRALRNLGKFWPAFWLGNLVGVTSNVLFAGLIVLFVLIVNTDFSFIAWTKHIFSLR